MSGSGQRIERIIVLGGGSAGFFGALGLKNQMPDLPVTVIRSKDIGIIGVGEGSTIALTNMLHQYLKVSLKTFYQVAQPTWKLGLKFVWGKRPFFFYTFSSQQMNHQFPELPKA